MKLSITQCPDHSKGPAEIVRVGDQLVTVVKKGEAEEFVSDTIFLNESDLFPLFDKGDVFHSYDIRVIDVLGGRFRIMVAKVAGTKLGDTGIFEIGGVITNHWRKDVALKIVSLGETFAVQPSERKFRIVQMGSRCILEEIKPTM